MKSIYCFILWLTFVIPAASAQYRIKGKVYETGGRTAAYATVALVAAGDSSIVKGAVSDETGTF